MLYRAIIFAVLASTANIAAANYSEGELKQCRAVSDDAESVMRDRQRDIPMADMMEAAAGSSDKMAMVEMAYQRPNYNSKRMQEGEILDFAEAYYKHCLKSLK